MPKFTSLLFFYFLLFFGAITAEAQVSGTVFRDYNANGVKDNTATHNEPFVAGVTVTVFSAAGASVGTTTTSAAGAYSFTGLTLPLRIEFTGLATGDYPGAVGLGNNTSVQFVSAASSNLNYGINYPDDYSQSNPKLATTCYVSVDPLTATTDPAIVGLNYNKTGKAAMVNTDKVGATWGLAYNKKTDKLYAASFIRRHAGLGPAGLGAIYVYPNATGAGGAVTSFMIPNVGSIGTNAARGLSTNAANHDATAFDKVGKEGLGDIDIDQDNQMLYVVNLFDKKIYKVDLTAALPTPVAIANYSVPSCTNGQFRPFALKVSKGKVYLGGVCSGETEATATTKTNLNATVLAYDIAAGTWSTVSSFSLNYPKEVSYYAFNPPGAGSGWYPWIDAIADIVTAGNFADPFFFSWPTPILSDIEFADDGAMILGFMDRTAMQFGANNYGTNTGNNTDLYYYVNGGDIIRATLSGSTYTREALAVAPTATTFNNSDEFFTGDEFLPAAGAPGDGELHFETGMGTLAIVAGKQEVITTAMDHDDVDQGAFYWMNTVTGAKNGGFVLYKGAQDGRYGAAAPSFFGKAAGLGDVEALSSLAPIEIGNRVWDDTDGDGVQDAGEAGISGITVTLCTSAGAPIAGATTTTDANGNYLFSSTTVAALQINTSYILKFPLTSGTKTLTTKDLGGNDLIDSDANATGQIAFTLGNTGQNNHSFDVGYMSCTVPTATASVTTQPTCGTPTATVTIAGFTAGQRYQYTSGATFTGTTTPATITAIPAGGVITTTLPNTTTAYTVRIFDASDNTCFVDRVVNVTAVVCCTVPTGVNIIFTPSTVVPNGTFNLTSTATGATTWAWGSSSGFTSSVQNPGNITAPATAGTYSYTVTASNNIAASCSTTAIAVLTVSTVVPPCTVISNLVASVSPNNISLGSSATLSVTGVGLIGTTTYTWAGTGLFSSSIQNPSTGTLNTAGDYTYTVTANNANGTAICTATATTTLNVFTCPQPHRYCSGSPLEVQLTAPTGYATYQWYRNGVLISGATNQLYLATATGSYNFRVTGGISGGTCGNQACCPTIITDDLAPICLDVSATRIR